MRQSVLSFPHMGSKDQTQTISLASQVPLPIELCASPISFWFSLGEKKTVLGEDNIYHMSFDTTTTVDTVFGTL